MRRAGCWQLLLGSDWSLLSRWRSPARRRTRPHSSTAVQFCGSHISASVRMLRQVPTGAGFVTDGAACRTASAPHDEFFRRATFPARRFHRPEPSRPPAPCLNDRRWDLRTSRAPPQRPQGDRKPASCRQISLAQRLTTSVRRKRMPSVTVDAAVCRLNNYHDALPKCLAARDDDGRFAAF